MPTSDNAEGKDEVVRLCSSWKALYLTQCMQSNAANNDAQQLMSHTSQSCGHDHSERASSSCSSSSCSSSTSDSSHQRSWVQGRHSNGMWTASYDSMSDTRMLAGVDAGCHESVSTACSIDGDADAWIHVQESDAYSSFCRLEVLDLTLPLIATLGGWDFSSHGFWAQTASNLEVLVGIGLVGKVALVGRGAYGEEIEMEVDAAGLRRYGGGGGQASANSGCDVWAMRVSADTDTMRSHGIDCPHCASNARAAAAALPWHPIAHRDAAIMHSSAFPLAPEAARAWWERAMCLARYMTFLAEDSRVAAHKESSHSSCASMMTCTQRVCSSQMLQLQASDYGYDLDFLGEDCDSRD
jgi:hypothetical protein